MLKSCEKFLGIKSDQHLKFDNHVNSPFKKASEKLRALARVSPYMSFEKKKLIMNSFFNGRFNCCPLTIQLFRIQILLKNLIVYLFFHFLNLARLYSCKILTVLSYVCSIM